MKRHTFGLISALVLLVACQPTTGGVVPGEGTGGAAAASSVSVSSSSVSSGGGGGSAPVPACIVSTPRDRPTGWRCARATDCYDGSPCTDDVCSDLGGCSNPAREGGCDAAEGWHGVCGGGACCPRAPGSATPFSGPR